MFAGLLVAGVGRPALALASAAEDIAFVRSFWLLLHEMGENTRNSFPPAAYCYVLINALDLTPRHRCDKSLKMFLNRSTPSNFCEA